MQRCAVLTVALGVGAACGSTPSKGTEPKQAREQCQVEVPEQAPEPPAVTDWWRAGPASCPEGAVLKGGAPPAGNEVWCETSDGTRVGKWSWWHENGRRLSDGQYNEQGEADGVWISWHENGGRKAQGSYTAGKRTGQWFMWHDNGALSTIIRFERGQRDGRWTWWYPAGKKAGEGEFRREKPHGVWTRCSEAGYVTKVEVYENDLLVDWIDFRNGRRLERGQEVMTETRWGRADRSSAFTE
jgi:hypothetical protein